MSSCKEGIGGKIRDDGKRSDSVKDTKLEPIMDGKRLLSSSRKAGWKLRLRSDKGGQASEKNSMHGSENQIHQNNIR